ncbi:8-amino-7-oxononanoate synthase, partial [bacterium]|nr:8-amino-7-oxononanoate synthase [bacterium]
MLPDLETDLLSIKQRNLYRRLVEIGSPHDPVVALDRNEVLLFCSNNYLGLASDPRVKNAAIECIETYGVSAPASRLISGHTPVHA